jgi:tRNA uridine 5-carboxymethylaminomethyl modification enzyme
LRQDNADERLTPLSHNLGLASDERLKNVELKIKNTSLLRKELDQMSVEPDTINPYLDSIESSPIKQKVKISSLVGRPKVSIKELVAHLPELLEKTQKDGFGGEELMERAEIEIKYEGYIQKEQEMADKLSRYENIPLPPDLPYMQLGGMSIEARHKLSENKPSSIGQASRISGVSPSDLSVLLVFIGR